MTPRLGAAQFLLPVFAVVALLAVPLAAFVVPLVGSGSAEPSVAALLFAVMVVYCAVRLGTLLWTLQARWVVLGVWIFSYAWLAVAGLAQTLAQTNPLSRTLPAPVATEQAALLLVGLICFDVATHVTPPPPPRSAGFGGLRRRVLAPGRVLGLGWVSLAITPAVVVVLGGPTALLSSREAVNDSLESAGLYSSASNAGGGLITVVGNVLPFLALLCLALLLADDPAVRRRPLPWAMAAALLGVNVLVNNPVSNPRYWAFAILLTAWFAWRGSARPVLVTLFVTGFALSALLVFPHLDGSRYSAESVRLTGEPYSGLDTSLDYVLAKTDYASVTDVGVVVQVVDSQGPQWGRQLLGTALFWLPRTVWPDKPNNTAFLVADEIQFVNRNLDSPLWAEGYVDFGWVGVLAYLGAAGVLARRLDDTLLLSRRVRTAAVPLAAAVVPVVAGYEFILLRGSLLQAMARIVVMLVVLWAVSTTVRRPDDPRPDDPRPDDRAVRRGPVQAGRHARPDDRAALPALAGRGAS